MDRSRIQRIQEVRERLQASYSPSCQLCELRCGADRKAGERGACGLAERTFLYRRLLHLGEEIELIPSYALWLAGCNFACTFCAEFEATRPPFPGHPVEPSDLAAAIAEDLAQAGARVKNINFVGGEPGISLPYIAEVALALHGLEIQVPPLLLNTNGYLTEPVLVAARDLFEIFVIDFKFSNDECARDLGAPDRYLETVLRTIRLLSTGNRSVWVRHLLMPGHIQCCTRQVISHLERLPPAIRVNLMPAFVPFRPGWRSLTPEEIELARSFLKRSRLRNRYWDGIPMG